MGDPRTFHYLNQTKCYEVSNVDDAREYIETRNAMDIVGISQEEQVMFLSISWDSYIASYSETSENAYNINIKLNRFFSKQFQDAIFRVVAAILHFGNIEFVKGKEIDSSQLKNEKSAMHLRTAAELLMYELDSSSF